MYSLERTTNTSCVGTDPDDPGTGLAYLPTSNVTGFNDTLDGTLTPWDSVDDCGIPMYEAGNINKQLASTAFLNWDCTTGTLCILVNATYGIFIYESNDDSWFRDYSVQQNVLTPISGSFNYIKDPDDSSVTIGWEGCYNKETSGLLPQCSTKVQVHANYDCFGETSEGRTTSTGKGQNNVPTGGGFIALDLSCPSPP